MPHRQLVKKDQKDFFDKLNCKIAKSEFVF